MQLSLTNPDRARTLRFLRRCSLVCSMLFAAGLLAAQTPQQPQPAQHAKKPAAHARHSKHAKTAHQKPAEVAAAPTPPPAPPKPDWPVDQPATPPTVTWDSHGLEIKAANSSLTQILSEVQMDTGAKVQGLTHDERIFGQYGPAPAREVLSQLLHGTDYNVLMLGDQGEGTPRELILSARAAGGAQTGIQQPQPAQQDQDIDGQDQPMYRPPMIQPGNPQMMTPQQRWQQMQEQRQRQMQQQIEQQQQQQQQQEQPQDPHEGPPPQ